MSLAVLASSAAAACSSSTSDLDHAQCLGRQYDALKPSLEQTWQDTLSAAKAADKYQAEQRSHLSRDLLDASDSPIQYEKDLRTSQQAWIAYWHAECSSESNESKGRTDRRLIYPTCAIRLTGARVGQLKNYKLGLTEGN
ncbi:MAG: lysozyme inhibitor LprI family protein [Novosphingobium sp.]